MLLGVIGSAGLVVVIAALVGAWIGGREEYERQTLQIEARARAQWSAARMRDEARRARFVAAARGELEPTPVRDPCERVRRLP